MTNVLEFRTKGGQTVIRDQEAINRKIQEQGQAIEGNTRKALDFDRQATAIARRQETAQERYNRLLATAKKAFDDGKISAETYNKEVSSIGREITNSEGRFKKFNEEKDKSFGAKAIAQFGPFLAQLGLVRTAQGLITEELRKQQELRNLAGDTKGRIAASQEAVVGTLGNLPEAEISRIQGEVARISRSTKAPEEILNPAFATALSRSNVNVSRSLSSLETASRFSRLNPQNIPAFTSAISSFANITGSEDSLANLDFLLKVGRASNVAELDVQARNLPKALIPLVEAGLSPNIAASLLAGTTVAAGDQTSEPSKTATLNLVKKLKSFGGEGPRGAIFRSLSPDQQLLKLFNDPVLGAEFAGSVDFEAAFDPVFKKFARGDADSALRREFAANLTGITSGTRAGGEEQIARLRRLIPLGEGTRTGQSLRSGTADLLKGTGEFLTDEQIKELLNQSALAGGVSTFDRIQLSALSVDGLTNEEAASFIGARADRLRQPKFSRFALPRGPNSEEVRRAEILEELQRDLLEQAERQTEILENLEAKTTEGDVLVGGPG